MEKRNLFSELAEGFQSLLGEYSGQMILRKHEQEVLLPSGTPSSVQTSSPVSSSING